MDLPRIREKKLRRTILTGRSSRGILRGVAKFVDKMGGAGVLLWKLLVHAVPVRECAAEGAQNLALAAGNVLEVAWRQDAQDVGRLIPSAQLDAVCLVGAPIVRPALDLVANGRIHIRIFGREKAVILVAEKMEDPPEVPGAPEPEVDRVEGPVQILPCLGPDE